MENYNLEKTADAWAKITLQIWQETLAKYHIGKPEGTLARSLAFFVHAATEGNPVAIDLFFKYYGFFVDWGVGKGVNLEHRDMLRKAGIGRQKKPWFTSTFYYQVKMLSEEIAETFALKSAHLIVSAAKTDIAEIPS